MARPAKNNSTTTLSPEEQAIVRRVEAESVDWATITEEDMHDFSLSVNPYDLDPNYPLAAQLQRECKYVFRWVEREPSKIDMLTRSQREPLRWKIANATTLPELADYVDPVLRCVCCLDQLLLFKRYEHAMIVNRAKQRMAEGKSPIERLKESAVDEKSEAVEGKNYRLKAGDVIDYQDTRPNPGEDVEVLLE